MPDPHPDLEREARETKHIAEAVLRNRPVDPTPREGLWTDYAQRMARAYLDAEQRIEELEEFVVSHTLLEQGITDFDLHGETVERFKRASKAPYVIEVIRAALDKSAERERG